jgi:hypothetical protein
MDASTLLSLSVYSVFVGMSIHYLSWRYCRREDVDDHPVLPFWRARPYLNKKGLGLWWLGTAIVIAAGVLFVVAANVGSPAR